MPQKKTNIRFIVIFGFVWIGFGIFGLIEAPERTLLTASQFTAGAIHLIYAFWLWRKSNSKRS